MGWNGPQTTPEEPQMGCFGPRNGPPASPVSEVIQGRWAEMDRSFPPNFPTRRPGRTVTSNEQDRMADEHERAADEQVLSSPTAYRNRRIQE